MTYYIVFLRSLDSVAGTATGYGPDVQRWLIVTRMCAVYDVRVSCLTFSARFKLEFV